jgi:hypothetical protein
VLSVKYVDEIVFHIRKENAVDLWSVQAAELTVPEFY